MQTYALLGNFNHMIPILKRLLATRLRCDYSCTTPARPDLGPDPQRSSFSGIGCGKEIVNGNGPTPAVSSRVGELLCHVERICQSGSDRDISNAPLFRIRDSSTALGMTKKGCSPQIIRVVGRLVALSHQRYPRFSRRWQCAFAQPCQTAPYHQFQTKGSNRFLANMRDCFFHRISRKN